MDINKKGFENIVLIVLVLVLAGALGYVTLAKKPDSSTIPADSERHGISLKNLPIAFEIPNGYAIFQREGFEGGYASIISVGKEMSSGHFYYSPLGIEFLSTAYDPLLEKEYTPSEYVDIVFNEQKKDLAANPQYIQLFGNKAVSYTNAADSSITIVGYLRANQIPKLPGEYLVRISSFTYGSGVGTDKELFDTVVNSLRVSK